MPGGNTSSMRCRTVFLHLGRDRNPTTAGAATFRNAYASLTPEQRRAFHRALRRFIDDTTSGRFRGSLRVKGIQGMPGVSR